MCKCCVVDHFICWPNLTSSTQNYLLGRKETCEMTDRNKEALLEVRDALKVFMSEPQNTPLVSHEDALHYRSHTVCQCCRWIYVWFFFPCRSVFVEVQSACLRWRECFGLKRMVRSPGKSDISFYGPLDYTTCQRAKPRLVLAQPFFFTLYFSICHSLCAIYQTALTTHTYTNTLMNWKHISVSRSYSVSIPLCLECFVTIQYWRSVTRMTNI